MNNRRLVFTKQAQEDAKKIAAAGFKEKTQDLLNILAEDSFQTPPQVEELVGDLEGASSRRINFHHRLVYQVLEEAKAVKILRMWTHYD